MPVGPMHDVLRADAGLPARDRLLGAHEAPSRCKGEVEAALRGYHIC